MNLLTSSDSCWCNSDVDPCWCNSDVDPCGVSIKPLPAGEDHTCSFITRGGAYTSTALLPALSCLSQLMGRSTYPRELLRHHFVHRGHRTTPAESKRLSHTVTLGCACSAPQAHTAYSSCSGAKITALGCSWVSSCFSQHVKHCEDTQAASCLELLQVTKKIVAEVPKN